MPEPRCVYQLRAVGLSLAFDGSQEFRSSTVFATRVAAESRIAKFRAQLTDRQRLNALADDFRLRIEVLELEVVDDSAAGGKEVDELKNQE